MIEKFFVDRDGNFLGAFMGNTPGGAVEVPTAPQHVAQKWVDGAWAPLTHEQVRSALPPLTRRQLRLTLVRNGISLETVEAAIASLPAGPARDEATIEWADASEFRRLNQTLLTIAAAIGISAEEIDAMWQEALAA